MTSVVILTLIMLSGVILSLIMFSGVILTLIMLSVIMLGVTMLSDVMPLSSAECHNVKCVMLSNLILSLVRLC